MDRYTLDTEHADFFAKERKKGRGAIIFGNPVCHEVASFLDESTYGNATRDRLIGMFFAGNISSVADNSNIDDFEFDIDDFDLEDND